VYTEHIYRLFKQAINNDGRYNAHGFLLGWKRRVIKKTTKKSIIQWINHTSAPHVAIKAQGVARTTLRPYVQYAYEKMALQYVKIRLTQFIIYKHV